jgi:hypothetical protein
MLHKYSHLQSVSLKDGGAFGRQFSDSNPPSIRCLPTGIPQVFAQLNSQQIRIFCAFFHMFCTGFQHRFSAFISFRFSAAFSEDFRMY